MSKLPAPQGNGSRLRQVFIDIETTGLCPSDGNRVIEIACVEAIDEQLTGRHLHYYLDPGSREVDPGVLNVHGISNDFLRGKPTFQRVADELLAFIADAQVLAHNATFPTGFLDNELRLAGKAPSLAAYCHGVVDTLAFAKARHPGERVNLAALSTRYHIAQPDHPVQHRALHAATRLALIYFPMTARDA